MNSSNNLSQNTNLDLDPALNGTLIGSITFAFNKLLQNVQNMLPAQIMAYDRTTNRAQVQILINILTADGKQLPRPQVASIPVLVLGGGGFMLSFPLIEGDLGWICANDRDISLFLQSYQQAAPNTTRMHSFSDGIFIPDVMRGYTIAPGDGDNAVLQSTDGTIKISLSTARVTVTAPLIVGVGNFAVDGNITASGTITPGVPVPP